MTPDRIVVMRGPGETRAALLAGEDLVEIVHIRDAEAQPGAVYAGCVRGRVPGSNDVFVDIGLPPPGVLEARGARLTNGSKLAVSVLTPARADKGPKLGLAKHGDIGAAPSLLRAAPDPIAQWHTRYAEAAISAWPRDEAARLRKVLNAEVDVAPDDAFDAVEEQIEAALSADVPLPGGGRISIETTKALVAVDIDSGSSSAERANAEAMTALARHMRLRNLAGRILVDLIPARGRAKLLKALKDACTDDPAQVQVMGLSPSGLIDVVRRRTRPSLAEMLHDGEAAAAYRALRLAVRELARRRSAAVTLKVAPGVAAQLNGRLAPALAEARAMAGGAVALHIGADFAPARVEVS